MNTYLHNQKVTCTIAGTDIIDARISIDKDGTPFICQNVKNGTNAEDKLGYLHSWKLYSDFTDVRVTNLKPFLKTWDNLTWKDIVIDTEGKKIMVLGILNDSVLMSRLDDFDSVDWFYTKKQLQELGYTIENPEEEIEEMTLEQVCKEIGRKIKIKE